MFGTGGSAAVNDLSVVLAVGAETFNVVLVIATGLDEVFLPDADPWLFSSGVSLMCLIAAAGGMVPIVMNYRIYDLEPH